MRAELGASYFELVVAVKGRKPKAQRRTRHRVVHDWLEVEDRPYDGRVPVRLPARRTIATRSGPQSVPLSAEAKAWWRDVRAMPHAVLWSRGDWRFAIATCLVADLAARGVLGASTELPQRETVLGLTGDARRHLRIKYVPVGDADAMAERDADIADLAAYRERVLGDGA